MVTEAGVRAGQVVAGRYQLEERIGAGGMGEVWRAVDQDEAQVVALKRAARGAEVDSERVGRRARREAKIAAGVRHPHVVAFIEEVVEGHERWLVMEYVPSLSLAQILDTSGPRSPEQVVHIGVQIASALEEVHARGIVHRDVKPGNVLITEDGTAKLTDFGISRPIYGDVTVTDSGLIGGTVAYLAPEVADGQDATPTSDVFALGATLFAAVEGMPPFGTADNPLLVLRRAAAGDLLPFRRAGPLTEVLSALLQPDPEKRPGAATARQMLQDLALAEGAGPGGSWWPAGSSRRPRRARRRAAAAAAAFVAALAIVAGIVVTRPADPTLANLQLRMSDAQNAEPCALIDTAVLSRFGKTLRESARGNFNRCDVIVQSASGSRVDVKVELETPTQAVPIGAGPVQVIREPDTGAGCQSTLMLAGQSQVTNRITITASMVSGPVSADLCAMAEAATAHAVSVLSRGEIPRRAAPFNTSSLAWVKACTLLDPAALTRVLGTGLRDPEIGFADWECRWRSTTSELLVTVGFDRDKVTTVRPGERGLTIAGRIAHEVPRAKEPQCDVRVDHRRDVDNAGKSVIEHLVVKVAGPQLSDQLCKPADDLAAVAAAKLPPSR